MKQINILAVIVTLILAMSTPSFAQIRDYGAKPMNLNVGSFQLSMIPLNGDGGLQSQFSWNLAGNNSGNTTLFHWPQDQWQSNMLYQIFNPLVLDNNGIIDEKGSKQIMLRGGAETLTNAGQTDWTMETRRYRPPVIMVDGKTINPPYRGNVDRTLKADIKLEFEDVLPQFGIRSHVEIFGFSNPELSDFFIWKATHKFTGETKLPKYSTSADILPDQTIKFHWPISFSFGPSKVGERATAGGFGFEGEDDYDSWFSQRTKFTEISSRETLFVAYYRDGDAPLSAPYSNGLTDDTGDPDRVSGHLYSTQFAGYTLLHTDRSYSDKSNDTRQPYSMPHAGITKDLWGRRGPQLKDIYLGATSLGKFPVEPPVPYDKGPMRFITTGPHELTKNSAQNRYDSLTLVYAVGAGSIGWKMSDSIGRAWFKKEITDQQKNEWIFKGKDSLFKALDRANWAWGVISKGGSVPAAPPAPDISVRSGASKITVSWSYEDPSYFTDPYANKNDFYAWRVYRKYGSFYVDDPNEANSGYRWEMIAEIKDQNVLSYVDTSVIRGVDYYYAVTAVDDGTANINVEHPNGLKLESSRYLNRTTLAASPFRQGVDIVDPKKDAIRVVPNPYVYGDVRGIGLHMANPNRVKFYNLPSKCKLRIFNESGDLVRTLIHDSKGDNEFWDLTTEENQIVASGVYILVATDSFAENGNPVRDQKTKFVIIR